MVIKGVNHTIIEVTNPENRYFERALLFVRPCLESVQQKQLQQQADYFVETVGSPPAQRIRQEELKRNRKIKRRICYAFWFVMGAVVGVVLPLVF